ncbi:MAG: thioredoxin family protein [Candidatus Methanoperedens sp.]|nr:thioredoxin family protein [Candidatus Methanoperedens sp.]MCE8428928.1 thioredoxin family protein [Candidatus Methanoperedens sp.]
MKISGIALFSILVAASMPAASETVQWHVYEEGILAAGTANKPMLLDFYADWCSPCVAMEEGTYPDKRVVSEMKDFVAIKIDTQKRIDIETRYGIAYYPTVVFLDPKGKEITRYIGYLGPEEMVEEIKRSRSQIPKETPGFESAFLLSAFIIFKLFKYY